jgi:hypothetical protein
MTARSPRGLLTAAALSTFLLAGACRDEPKIIVKANGDTSLITGRDGAVVDAAEDGKSLAIPADLPAFAPAYPGARLATRIGSTVAGESEGTLLVFETADPVEKVSAFYDARAREAGAKATMEVTETDSSVRIHGGGANGKGSGAMIAISRSDESPVTEIVITSGLPKAEVVKLEEKPGEWRRAVRLQ